MAFLSCISNSNDINDNSDGNNNNKIRRTLVQEHNKQFITFPINWLSIIYVAVKLYMVIVQENCLCIYLSFKLRVSLHSSTMVAISAQHCREKRMRTIECVRKFESAQEHINM